jgi:internalin A
MPDQDRAVSRPWRRYLRFSVRGLIVLVLVIGLGLGWIVTSAHIQRDAVAAVQDAGGSVNYDWDESHGTVMPGGKPWAPRWVVNLVGVDYFGHVVRVTLGPPTATDTMMVQLGRLTGLQQLILYDTSISDARMVHLKSLSNLTILMLIRAPVTDAGLAHLKGMTNLSTLDLRRTMVTDAGLAHLKGLTRLRSLFLNDTQITDAGLLHLRGLTNLEILELHGTRVTDAGTKGLKEALPNLQIFR